jgi:hypothetical protein
LCRGDFLSGIIREPIKIGGAGQRQRTVQVKVKRMAPLGDNGVTRTRVRSRKAALTAGNRLPAWSAGKSKDQRKPLGCVLHPYFSGNEISSELVDNRQPDFSIRIPWRITAGWNKEHPCVVSSVMSVTRMQHRSS